MAAIAIRVENDLYTIETDQWEWTGLIVNGSSIPQKPGGGYTYSQTTPGPVDFTVTADKVDAADPGPNLYIMDGSDKSHICVLTFSDKGAPFQMKGLLDNVSPRNGATAGPFPFSQPLMTGVFEKA